MSGPINTGSFAQALWPGVNRWYGDSYKEFPTEWTDLFDQDSSDKAYEELVGISGFGLAMEKSEGSGIQFDSASQTWVTRAINKTYTLGFVLTQELLEDNQYRIATLGKRDARALAFSMRQTKEIVAANVYNRAFTSGYTFGDGSILCVSSHPNKVGGTWSNVPTVASDLSEAALEQAFIDIGGFTADRGTTINVMPKTLVVHRSNFFEAVRILKSELQNDTANNAVNALRIAGAFPGGVKINHYLTDADAWFVRTNCPDGMICFNRVAMEFDMDNDFSTTNAMYRARERYSFTCGDPRAIYGSAGG